MTPNALAWAALFSWPLVAALLYRACSLRVAVLATLLGGYLLLPERVEIDLPVLPPLNKHTIPALSALAMLWLAARDSSRAGQMQPGWLPRDRLALALIALLLIGAFGTALTNLSPVVNGPTWLPGMRLYDGFSLALRAIVLLLPFVIARKLLATAEGQRTLAIALVVSAAAYALLALWEVRMSPQLNREIYGFFPHSWVQHRRAGGFRPIVFLQHGLWVGIFFATAAVIAFAMVRAETGRARIRFALAGLWLLVTIVLSKVLTALSITLALLPVALLLSRRGQVLVAVTIGVVVLSYPALRNLDLVPTRMAVNIAESIDPARAESLEFRLRNEDILLQRAREKPLFGWGGYGRNRVYDERGEDISTTDGRWVILFGQGGWVRYIGEFGLLLLAVFRLALRPRERIDPVMVALTLGLVANLIDLLPNSGQSVVTWLLAGALVGRMEREEVPGAEPAATAAPPTTSRQIRYARDLGPATPPRPRRAAPSERRT